MSTGLETTQASIDAGPLKTLRADVSAKPINKERAKHFFAQVCSHATAFEFSSTFSQTRFALTALETTATLARGLDFDMSCLSGFKNKMEEHLFLDNTLLGMVPIPRPLLNRSLGRSFWSLSFILKKMFSNLPKQSTPPCPSPPFDQPHKSLFTHNF